MDRLSKDAAAMLYGAAILYAVQAYGAGAVEALRWGCLRTVGEEHPPATPLVSPLSLRVVHVQVILRPRVALHGSATQPSVRPPPHLARRRCSAAGE
jgi:hypothetical protein